MAEILADVFRLSRTGETISGTVAARDLTRLALHTGRFLAGELRWMLSGTEGRKELPGMMLHVEGVLEGTCCRCEKPLRHEVLIDTSFLMTRTEAEADALPIEEDEDDEIIVGSSRFEVLPLIEEEVILSLPLFPSHEACNAPENPLREEEDPGMERVSPFAVLASMKKH